MRYRTALVVGGALALIAIIAFATLGGDDQAAQPAVSTETVGQLNAAVAALPPVEGATDLEQMRSPLGPPDAFTLALEPAEDGRQTRREEWFYFELLSVYEFADGRLVSNLPLEETSGLLAIPAQYDPADFTLAVTWEEVAANLADPEGFESYEFEPELAIEGNYYVGAQLLLVFDEAGLLAYVEAVPLEAEVVE